MQVIINWHEKTAYTATIEIDPDAVRAYWEEDTNIRLDGPIPDWMVQNYLCDQREAWLEQVNVEDATDRISDTTRTLDEINVIS